MATTYTPGPKGLYNKYNVNNQDGTPVEGPTFTLRPYDPHAQKALLVYADSVFTENRQLAADLRKMVEDAYNHSLREESMIEGPNWHEIGEQLGLYHEPPEVEPHLWHDKEIEVCDSGGEVVAVIVHEYDPGDPGVRYHKDGSGTPPTEGYSYWRFQTLAERVQ